MSDQGPSDFEVVSPKGGNARPVSLVWLVPIIALGIALFIAWQSYSGRGPLIEIKFANGEGVTEGSTLLKYRNVTVGEVEKVRFAKDLSHVIVGVRIDKDIDAFIDRDASFWIVRPQITARGVSGLETLLGGVFIEGAWDSEPGGHHGYFEGLERPPLVTGDQKGTRFTVRVPDGSQLAAGAPIVFRGIKVGFIDLPELTESGDAVTAQAFVTEPHNNLLNTSTRFWDTSGFSVDVGLQGISLNVGSLASLIEGGLSFNTFGPAGAVIQEGHVYDVFKNEASARSSAFTQLDVGGTSFSILFDGSVGGLSAGSPVEYRGLQVGTVSGLSGVIIGEGPDRAVKFRADIKLQPERLGLLRGASEDEVFDFVNEGIESGMRARLEGIGLLGRKLKVVFVSDEDAEPETLDRNAKPHPVIPAMESETVSVADTAQGVLSRFEKLPLENLVTSVGNILEGVERLVNSDDVRAAPGEVIDTIREIREKVASLPIEDLSNEATGAVADVREILDQVRSGEAIPSLVNALDRVDNIAASLESASAQLPQVLESVQQLAAKGNELDLEDLVGSATNLVSNANNIFGSEAVAAIPGSLMAAIDDISKATNEVSSATTEFTTSEAMPSLIAALERADSIATSLDTTAAELPALVTSVEGLATNAANLPLDELVASASKLLKDADAIVGSEEATQLPQSIKLALDELTLAISDVQEITSQVADSTAIASLLEALDRTSSIAESVDNAAASLPTLIIEIENAAQKAADLPLDELVASADKVLASADVILATPEAAQLPASLKEAIDELSLTLANVNVIASTMTEGTALESLKAALDHTASIASSVDAAAAGLPELVANIQSVAAEAADLPLEELVTSANDLVQSADTLVSSPDTAKIPASLSSALDEVSAALQELRDGGAVENANSTLASASAAASAVEKVADSLPELVADLQRLLSEAEALVGTYGARSDFNNQTLGVLRDLRDTARAVTSLARTIERKPNSLLVGR